MATASSTSGEQMTQRILRISDIAKEPLEMLMPISGYEDMPLVSLEVAVEPLVLFLPTVQSYAYSAKQRCQNPPADGLTIDESSSIMLYSMGWKPLDKCLYFALNAALRSKDREKLEPWYLYLKLFLTALSRLPSAHQFIFRGVKLDLHTDYPKEKMIVWWGFSSCTASLDVLQSELFLGKTSMRTLFTIECYSGKDIRKHSYFSLEDEILLPAATQFKVRSCLNQGTDLYIIQLLETQPPFPLLQPIFPPSESNKSFSDNEIKQTPDTNIAAVKPKFYKFQRALSNIIGKKETTKTINENARYDINSDKETKQKSETNIASVQPKIDIIQDIQSYIIDEVTTKIESSALNSIIHLDTKWVQNGATVAGGNGQRNKPNQLASSVSIYVDDDQTIYIADSGNHRIMEWKCGATIGQAVAGGNGQGNETNQLSWPTDVILDKEKNNFIICDLDNRRIMRWPRQNGTTGQIIISNIDCCRLTMDNNGYLYVSDKEKHEVRRWKMDDTDGALVAGGNGKGNGLNQLNNPTSIFVDEDRSVYVSDCHNQRVMKWMEGANEGIVVAGGQGKGNSLTQLSGNQGLIVDQLGTVYVADRDNHRIMRWIKGATQGSIVVGGNGNGKEINQLSGPFGLSFDREGNLYVVDNGNHRVQRFSIHQSSIKK